MGTGMYFFRRFAIERNCLFGVLVHLPPKNQATTYSKNKIIGLASNMTKEKNTINFLIVEDDPTYAIRLQMLVEELGYEVIGTADNGGSALELIYSKEPDFILMDIEIKGTMTGLDIAEAVKELGIPVLFITSFSNEENYARSENVDATAFLVKPLDGYSLKSAIRLAVQNMYLTKGKKMEKESNENQFLLDKYLLFKRENVYQ